MRTWAFTLLLWPAALLHGQGYTHWRTGAPAHRTVQPAGGVCMMGGASEHDNAMRWFLQRANGGDVLVLRASGSNGYNNYLYSELGVAVNSVETIRFDDASAATAPYVHQRINEADAIWFAGGDQWNYVNYWRGTAIDSLVNVAISERDIVIGGTSAGMAILGGTYFTAQYGSIGSAAALADPYAVAMAVSSAPFLRVPWMEQVVTDTHYDNPDRRGRHLAFMARTVADQGIDAKGIACNEYVAVTIDPQGEARVWGEWPQYAEYAWFLQVNCTTPGMPETCTAGQPLTWHHAGHAVKAFKVPGTMDGDHTFQLTDWRTGTGGTWEDWSAVQGLLTTAGGEAMPDCATAIAGTGGPGVPGVWATMDATGAHLVHGLAGLTDWTLVDASGRRVPAAVDRCDDALRVVVPGHGVRFFRAVTANGPVTVKLVR